MEFGRGKLGLGFEQDCGASVLNCVPNSALFLSICDLALLVAEDAAAQGDEALRKAACQRAKLALAAETAYITIYKHPDTDGNFTVKSYSYENGPFPGRIDDAQMVPILDENAAHPDDVSTLRAKHRAACTGTRDPLPFELKPTATPKR